MPEGPEVKKIAASLTKELMPFELGKLWLSTKPLRKRVDEVILKTRENTMVEKVEAYGKILFFYSAGQPVLTAQMGMTGQLKLVNSATDIEPHTHIRWKIKNSTKELRYVDIRRFGLVDVCDERRRREILSKLGPDPFNLNRAGRLKIIASIQKSSRAIKEILLDQSVVCGVGNIYASESLFLARINPMKKGLDINEKKCQDLIKAVVLVLQQSYRNGGTTFSDYVDAQGNKGDNFSQLKVFKRESKPCLVCVRPVIRIKQSGRSTFFCDFCQS